MIFFVLAELTHSQNCERWQEDEGKRKGKVLSWIFIWKWMIFFCGIGRVTWEHLSTDKITFFRFGEPLRFSMIFSNLKSPGKTQLNENPKVGNPQNQSNGQDWRQKHFHEIYEAFTLAFWWFPFLCKIKMCISSFWDKWKFSWEIKSSTEWKKNCGIVSPFLGGIFSRLIWIGFIKKLTWFY